MRVALVVVQLPRRHLLRLPAAPLDIPVAAGADGISHDLTVTTVSISLPGPWILAEDCLFPISPWIFYDGSQADSFNSSRGG